ncbi:hypothetical protein SS50377_25363 [Spironucleus salmonicida]|uniref:Uncharacterized protein n=1 Tax=Spironucleus salmonicida TaxID=348837 RepID=V6LBD4_9EUKA|nr:hypothetical protein SS50377_25363 [Spironucleus salmonicida]|eukprot:EST41760.1 Hypothetical protein SS50377_18593 [Spironucleus salmonicida]
MAELNKMQISLTNFNTQIRCAAYHYESNTPCYVTLNSSLIHFNSKVYQSNDAQFIFYMKFHGDILIVASMDGILLIYKKINSNLEYIDQKKYINLIWAESIKFDNKLYISLLFTSQDQHYDIISFSYKDDQLIPFKNSVLSIKSQIPPVFTIAVKYQQVCLSYVQINEKQFPSLCQVQLSIDGTTAQQYQLKITSRNFIPEQIQQLENNIFSIISSSTIYFVKIDQKVCESVQPVDFSNKNKLKPCRGISVGGLSFYVDNHNVYVISNDVIKGYLETKLNEVISIQGISSQNVCLEKSIFAVDFHKGRDGVRGQIFVGGE